MTAKKKPMTKAEKKFRARVKADMQDKGILPPDKAKLNRKKYIDEAQKEWNQREKGCYVWDFFLYKAMGYTLGLTDRHLRVSPEAVGVAKTLKLAIRLKEFSDKLKTEGRKEYELGEEYEFIKDIINA